MIITVLGMLMAFAAIAIDISLPATPLIAVDLQSNLSGAQLVVTVFLAGLALGQIPAGLASDHFGRKPVIFYGVVVFTVASAVCALSQELNQLLTARFIQGLAAAVGPVVSRAIVRDISSGIKAAHMMSILVTILTIAPLLAPMVGSLVIGLSGWRAVYWVTVIFGALTLFLSARVLPETAPSIRQQHHPFGQLSENMRHFFAIRQCWTGLLMVALPAGAYLAIITSASTIMADLYGVSAEAFGPLFAIGAFAFMIGAMISRRLVNRFGILRMISLGSGIFITVIAAFSLIFIVDGFSLFTFWAAVSLYMLGYGLIMPNATALALDLVPEISGLAAAIVGTAQIAFGTCMSFLVATFYDHNLTPLITTIIFCGLATTLIRWLAFPHTPDLT